jgi:hypothetical protein
VSDVVVGRLVSIAGLLALALGAAPAVAATVVLVQPANPAPAMVEALVRVRGELSSAGFEVTIADAPAAEKSGGESRVFLERLAAGRDADAVVAMLGEQVPDSVEVWVVDKLTGKSVVRRVPFRPLAERAPETLAIQAIELLRASFVEIELSARGVPEGRAAPPPPEVVRFVGRAGQGTRAERFAIEVGGAVAMGLDGLHPAVMPLVRFDWAARPWLLLHATAAGLGTRASVQNPVGKARVAQQFVALGASYRFRAGKRLRPFLSLASGILHTSADGEPGSVEYQGLHPEQWSFLVDAGLGLGLRLPDRFSLSLAVHAQMAEPYPAIRFADSAVATAHRPNLLFTLTVGAWL